MKILNLDFGRKFMHLIGGFLQLPSSVCMIFEHLAPTHAWHLFILHELKEIVYQNGDSEFAELLSRVFVGEQLNLILQPYLSWQILIFLTGQKTISDHLVGKRNVEVMKNAINTIFTIYAVDGGADGHIGAFQFNLSDDIDITKTKSLKKILKLWVGARVQLTDNLDVKNKLCNGSEGAVKYIHICTSTSSAKDGGTLYVQFDNVISVSKRKSNSLPEELQSCVPTLVKARKFSYSLHGKNRKSNLIFCERK